MPRGCWRTLFLVTSYALLVAGARGSQLILHNDTAIQYSKFNHDGNHGECSKDGACQNQWWVEENETGDHKISTDEHATRGPLAWLTLGLRGTKTLALQGKPDGDAQKGISVVFHGSDDSHIGPLNAKGPSDGQFFSTNGLNPGISYTMNMSYTGKDFLRIVGVLIDSGGKFNSPGQEPSSTPPPPATKSSGEEASSTQTSLTVSEGGSLPSSDATGTGSTRTSSTSAIASPSATRTPTGASARTPTSRYSGDTVTRGKAYSSPPTGSPPRESPAAGGSTVGSGTNSVNHGKRNGTLIGGIVAGVLILLLLLPLLYLYLRRRQRARRAPSYPFRARGFQFRKEVEHWTDRPISPIVPTSGDWESFAFPPEKDEEGARKVSERRSTLSSRMGIAL